MTNSLPKFVPTCCCCWFPCSRFGSGFWFRLWFTGVCCDGSCKQRDRVQKAPFSEQKSICLPDDRPISAAVMVGAGVEAGAAGVPDCTAPPSGTTGRSGTLAENCKRIAKKFTKIYKIITENCKIFIKNTKITHHFARFPARGAHLSALNQRGRYRHFRVLMIGQHLYAGPFDVYQATVDKVENEFLE